MQRQGFTIPLLIGGATTSRAHTAVKVDPKYDGPVVWVKDASRSVPVTAALLDDRQRDQLMANVKEDYDSLRARHAAKNDRPLLTLEEARADAHPDRVDGLPAAAAHRRRDTRRGRRRRLQPADDHQNAGGPGSRATAVAALPTGPPTSSRPPRACGRPA